MAGSTLSSSAVFHHLLHNLDGTHPRIPGKLGGKAAPLVFYLLKSKWQS